MAGRRLEWHRKVRASGRGAGDRPGRGHRGGLRCRVHERPVSGVCRKHDDSVTNPRGARRGGARAGGMELGNPLFEDEQSPFIDEGSHMLRYTIAFLVVALIAAVLGFGGLAGAAAGIAKILFFVFLVLFVLSLFTRRTAA